MNAPISQRPQGIGANANGIGANLNGIGLNPQDTATGGWLAQLRLRFSPRAKGTRLIERSQLGPLAVQRPFYPEPNACHSYLLHPPGGVVGGDQLEIDIGVDSGAHALITTPGATKFYRSAGAQARQQQRFRVEAGGLLEWLPLETIFFPEANARLDTEIDIAPGGHFIGWEMHCFGRPALQECFKAGQIGMHTAVKVDGQAVLLEQLQIRDEDMHQSAAGLRGYAMSGCLLAVGVDAQCLDLVRELLQQISSEQGYAPDQLNAAVTLLDDGADNLLVVRALGQQSEVMLDCFSQVWALLRRHWLQIEPCPPRIWAT